MTGGVREGAEMRTKMPEIIGNEDDDMWFVGKHVATDESLRIAMALYAREQLDSSVSEAFDLARNVTFERVWFRYCDPNNDELMRQCDCGVDGALPFIRILEPVPASSPVTP